MIPDCLFCFNFTLQPPNSKKGPPRSIIKNSLFGALPLLYYDILCILILAGLMVFNAVSFHWDQKYMNRQYWDKDKTLLTIFYISIAA